MGVLLAILTVLIATASPAAAATPRPVAADWAQDGHDGTHDGFNPDEYAITAGTVKGLVPRWSVSTPPGASDLQAPLIAGSRLFLADTTGVSGYEPATGTSLWRFPVPAQNAPVLATDGATVLAYLRPGAGELVALDAASGAVRWRQPVPSTTPDGRLLLDNDVAVAGTSSGAWAFDVPTGKPLWSRPGMEPQWPVADGKILLSRPGTGGVDAASIVTGRLIWHSPRDWFGYAADPTGRFFLVGDDANLLKVRASSGQTLWERPGLWGIPAIDHDRVYTSAQAEPDTLVAVDLQTGDERWRRPVGLMPSVAGGVVWASHATPDQGWRLEAVDPAAGTPLDLPDLVHASGGPDRTVIAHGWLYTTDGATLHAFTVG